MKIAINNVNIRYENGEIKSASINFEIFDEGRNLMSVNGYRNLTSEEYENNNSIEALESLIRESLRELSDTASEDEE